MLILLNFCNGHKIRCFGYDWMMNQFITNKDINIDFHSNLPAFVFILTIIIFTQLMIKMLDMHY